MYISTTTMIAPQRPAKPALTRLHHTIITHSNSYTVSPDQAVTFICVTTVLCLRINCVFFVS